MTNFERITQSPESLAVELDYIDTHDYASRYCRNDECCVEDMENIDPANCRKCLIAWLNSETEETNEMAGMCDTGFTQI